VAVGAYSTSGDTDDPVSTTLVEAWNGASWAVIPSPTPGAGNLGALASVACEVPDSCIAVGNYSDVNDPYRVDSHGLVEDWNGTTFSVAPEPNEASQGALQAITCSKPLWCVAVGSSMGVAYGSTRTLAQVWNGTAWTVAAHAISGALEAVACPAPTTCLAVGEHSPSDSVQQALGEWLGGLT
jgi:hypothetical protein